VPADVLSCSTFSPHPFPSHCFLPQSHAEVEGGKTGGKNTHSLHPLHLLPLPHSHSTFLSQALNFYLSHPLHFFLHAFRRVTGWGGGERWRGAFAKQRKRRVKDHHLICLTAVITYSQRPSFPLHQARTGRKRETEGEEGELGRKSSPPCCCPCASKETIYLYPSACVQKIKQIGPFKIPHLQPDLSLRPLRSSRGTGPQKHCYVMCFGL